jgi:phosphatidylcholine synthase
MQLSASRYNCAIGEQESDVNNNRNRLKLAALGVHVLTASGAALGLLALERAVAGDFQAMFAWLALALFVDGIDGTLARMADVRTNAPWVDGEILDLVVDFLTYVVVPATAIWKAGLMPPVIGAAALLLLVTASAVYFADKRMKTADHWFRGFPAIWNVVALYLLVFPLPGLAVFGIILVLTAQMFVPIVFVHPMRVEQWRVFTHAVGAVWCVCAALAVYDGMRGPWLARAGLLLTGLYFVLLPLARRRQPQAKRD